MACSLSNWYTKVYGDSDHDISIEERREKSERESELLDITDDIRTISPRCAIGFKDHASNDWLEHGGAADDRKGVCYYED